MDMKQSIETAVFVIAAIALIASFFNLLSRERRREVGYTYGSGGEVDWNSGSSNSSSDTASSVGHGGSNCSDGGFSSGDGSCGGGDGGG
ncbi:hypothetical protein ACLBX9_12185 [Methylobacterium sp. A49B]